MFLAYVNAKEIEVTKAWDSQGVVLRAGTGTIRLEGKSKDILKLIEQIADLYNFEVSPRQDPDRVEV